MTHYDNDYKWIKVKQFRFDPKKSWEENFRALESHHKEETTFLIEEIRNLAKKNKKQMETFTIGFTGCRHGLTERQKEKLEELLGNLTKGCRALCFHNDGQGADQVFEEMANSLGLTVSVTPDDLRPMPRNRHLVKTVDMLLACPPTDEILKKGSGTWETIKYMWKKPGNVIIVLSDGSIKRTKEEFKRKKE